MTGTLFPDAFRIPRSTSFVRFSGVITGFNTDIEHDGVVYHVQTEDKGPATPFILSLVYDRGTILASKRVPYEMDGDEIELDALAERLQRQHKLMCAAVNAGRLEDLKRMTSERAAARKAGPAVSSKNGKPQRAKGSKAPITDVETPPDTITQPTVVLAETELDLTGLDLPIPKPDPQPEAIHIDYPPSVADFEVLDDSPIFIPAEELSVVSSLAGGVRPEHDNLSIEFVGDSRFRSGDRKMIALLVCRGSRREIVRGAEIMVKVLGSDFRPVIFHAASDNNGLANIHLQVPKFQGGRAVVLARVINNGEEVEVRRPVSHAQN